jgi:hypothetical protein
VALLRSSEEDVYYRKDSMNCWEETLASCSRDRDESGGSRARS